MGGEITTAHIALILTVLALVVPVLTAIAMFLLQRIFGTGDKASAEIDELKEKVHALELAQVGQYATKPDLEALRTEVRQGFAGLRADVNQILKHFSPNAVLVG